MKLLNVLTVHRPGEAPKKIELYEGDLTTLKAKDGVDVLVVSAFRGDYPPTSRSLIGALQRNRNISVADLAREKAVDLRDYFSCWLSKDLTERYPDCGFKRILCFEPETNAHEIVEHLFQALAPFLGGKTPLSTVAMPLVATGALGSTTREILAPVINSAVEWMKVGFPLRCLKIVAYENSAQLGEAAAVFSEVKTKHHRWDVFISYCHQDREEADVPYNELAGQGFEVFRDTKSLLIGTEWFNEISNSIRSSSFFVPLYSKDYLNSQNCLYEYSIALASKKPLLFPISLCEIGDLPVNMTQNHVEVCAKGDGDKLRQACRRLISQLRGERLPNTLI